MSDTRKTDKTSHSGTGMSNHPFKWWAQQPEQEMPRESPWREKPANATFKCNYARLPSNLVGQPVSLETQRGGIFQKNISVGSQTFAHGLLWCFDPAHLCRWKDAQVLGSSTPPFCLTCHFQVTAAPSGFLAWACLCCWRDKLPCFFPLS